MKKRKRREKKGERREGSKRNERERGERGRKEKDKENDGQNSWLHLLKPTFSPARILKDSRT